MIEEQISLLSTPAAPAAPSTEGEYTLARVLARRPDSVRIAAGLLVDGAPILDVARICRMSPHTVMEIKARQTREAGGTVADDERESLSGTLRRAAFLCAETVAERLQCPVTRGRESTRDLAQAIGIMVPQSELLAGRASARVAIEGPSPADILQEMRDISSSVVIGPCASARETGQEAGNRPPPGPLAPAAGPETHETHEQAQGPQTAGRTEVAP
jgi:hypothetical protein